MAEERQKGEDSPDNKRQFERVRVAIDRHSEERRSRDIVAVAHGGPILGAVSHAMRLDPRAAVSVAIGNLSLTRLHFLHEPQPGGPQWRVLGIGERPLGGELSSTGK